MLQKQDPALINVPIPKHQDICSFEIDFNFAVRYELRTDQNPSAGNVFLNRLFDGASVFFAPGFWSAHDDQTIVVALR
jgi:hypothetical protein